MGERRWYDSAKVIWSLFGVTMFMLVAYAGVLWNSVGKASADNAAQDVKIQRLETSFENIEKRQERMESKIDTILTRMPR